MALKEQSNLHLTVLARIDYQHTEEYYTKIIRENNIQERNVEIITKKLEPYEVERYIKHCNLVALPFLVTPSDMPIAFIEAISFNKPVLAFNICCVSEFIKAKYLASNRCCKYELSDMMSKLNSQTECYDEFVNDMEEKSLSWSWTESFSQLK